MKLGDEIGLVAAELMISELRRIVGDSQSQATDYQAVAEARAIAQVRLFDDHNSVTATPLPPGSQNGNQNGGESDSDDIDPQPELSKCELEEELNLATTAALQLRNATRTSNSHEATVDSKRANGSHDNGDKEEDGEDDFDLLSLDEDIEFIVLSSSEDENNGTAGEGVLPFFIRISTNHH